MEGINLFLHEVLSESPGTHTPSAYAVLRTIEERLTGNVTHTAPNLDKSYDYNAAEKLNRLLLE